MKLGCYVPLSGSDKVYGAVLKMLEYGANCMMGYTGAPTNTLRSPIDLNSVKKAEELLLAHNLSLETIIIHAPYILSLPSPEAEKRAFSREFLAKEIERTNQIGGKFLVFHSGSYKDNLEDGIKRLADSLNKALEKTKDTSVVLLLETSAGKGTEIGKNFDEIRQVIELINDKSRIGVCLDTCHIYDAGYDIKNNLKEVLADFEQTVGLNYLKVIHLNDSVHGLNSHRDRHANIGYGQLGFEALCEICWHPKLIDIYKILETPYDVVPPYKEEIQMLRNKKFNDFLKTKGEKNE
ncbi:MAG: deoxyribonuclease IV [Erysipelotrichales bacterium]|nr:deoxyribonuclease IV [Erysipelotrichales bacterium]